MTISTITTPNSHSHSFFSSYRMMHSGTQSWVCLGLQLWPSKEPRLSRCTYLNDKLPLEALLRSEGIGSAKLQEIWYIWLWMPFYPHRQVCCQCFLRQWFFRPDDLLSKSWRVTRMWYLMVRMSAVDEITAFPTPFALKLHYFSFLFQIMT